MQPIPKKLRNEIAEDPFYKKCCVPKALHNCEGRIEWHHNLIFAGRQVNEKFAILPVCHNVHEAVYRKDFRNYLDWVMINRMTIEDFKKYPRSDWVHKHKWLNKICGKPKNRN